MMYLFNFILFSAVFWGLYRILLKRETFFTLNRIYLLVVPLLAALLPFLKIDRLAIIQSSYTAVNLPEFFIPGGESVTASTAVEETSGISVFTVMLGIYGLGVLISLSLFFYKLYKINRLKTLSKISIIDQHKTVWLPDTEAAFSFFKTIFLGENVQPEELKQIFLHEKEHIRQKHSWDLLYYECLKVLAWFNPFLYLMQRDLSEVHEFSVDQQVAKAHSKKAYVESLLRVSFDTRQLSFTNSFYTQNQLKIRIMMLYKNNSSKKTYFKYLIVICSILLMLVYVSCDTSESEKQIEGQSDKSGDVEKIKTISDPETIPFQAVEKAPEFKDSPEFKSNEERKKYFSNKVSEFFLEHFDSDEAKKYGDEGINRIAVQFAVDETGTVRDIKARARQSELEEMAIYAVSRLPQVNPGETSGTPVRIVYQLPVIFNNNKKETAKQDED